jgi:hypothetical protein
LEQRQSGLFKQTVDLKDKRTSQISGNVIDISSADENDKNVTIEPLFKTHFI